MKKILIISSLLTLQACQSTNNSTYDLCKDDLGKPRTIEAAPLVIIEPRYPQEALNNKIKGHVKLTFTVANDASIGNVKVIEAVPEGLFERVSIRAINRWKFKPKCNNGQLVNEPIETTLNFNGNEVEIIPFWQKKK